jgi:hypothetical protein
MASADQIGWRVETWLQIGDKIRRPTTKKAIPIDDFEAQKKENVEYVIFERRYGTYSDGKGGRPIWKEA